MDWVRRELREIGVPPLKRFGQHFLRSEEARDRLVEAAELSREDLALEVGAGLGFVTSALAARAGKVVAIEKDRTLAKYLQTKFSATRNVQVIEGDALAVPIAANAKIVSSPPYNISSRLIIRILNSRFSFASLLLQEDFVRRLTASNGTKDYGRLTVMLQSRAQPRYVSKVAKSAFYPSPKVDSAIVTIQPSSNIPCPKDLKIFEDIVRILFTQRRRQIRGVMSRYLDANHPSHKQDILSKLPLTEKRVYQLTPLEFVEFSDVIADSIRS